MSLWRSLGDIAARIPQAARCGLSELIEAVRTVIEGDPSTRRKVAFSVAMIALSAKMAKADGVVTPDEVQAFAQVFAVPAAEARNVSRLYDVAKTDVLGFELYAQRMAKLCANADGDTELLEDVLAGLFHIAAADGVLHEREEAYLRRIAEIFQLSEARYAAILAQHADGGRADPYRVLGVSRDEPFSEVRRQYRQLVRSNHPDHLIARGLPEEFVAIATRRLAAINTAFETIERAHQPA